MGLQKQYLRYGRSARDHLFGWLGRGHRQSASAAPATLHSNNNNNNNINNNNSNHSTPANAAGDANASSGRGTTGHKTRHHRATPLSMLISHRVKLSNHRLAVIIIGIVTLALGILLTTIPWLDYFILKNLRLWNDTISFHYWQRPGVIRLTKLYIYNVTNPDGFLLGEKPRLQEVGPFVYREDMEKVNVRFYDNFTVSYQHKKILQFVPELSIDKNTPIVTPNIPLLTLTSLSPKLGYLLSKTISFVLTAAKFQPFVNVTADELVFGYDDALVTLAHRFYPQHLRPKERMGLLIGRNGTMPEVSTIRTGQSGMHEFGYIDRLNGNDELPHWARQPCRNITASEGSFFPPRDLTKSNVVHLYDRDLCRVIPLHYEKSMQKDGIDADLYRLPENVYGDSANNPENACFDIPEYKALKGLQNISPCHFGAPVYISNPHFYQADPSLLEAVEGLEPDKEAHETTFKIQPKLGVPLEGKVRIQLNLKVTHAPAIHPVKDFREFMFPVMWLEEGISEVTPAIRRWMYLATVFAPTLIPVVAYSLIIGSALAIVYVFVRTYQNFMFAHDPALEILEMGRRSLRRGSSFIAQHQHRFLMHRESYSLLKVMPVSLLDDKEEVMPIIDSESS